MDLGSGFTPSSFTCLRTATHKYNDHCELCIRHIDEETLESFICWFVTKIRAWKHDLCIIHLVTVTHCTTLHQTEGMEVVVLSVQPVRRNNKTALKRMPQSRTAPAQNCGHHHARSRVKLHFHRISPLVKISNSKLSPSRLPRPPRALISSDLQGTNPSDLPPLEVDKGVTLRGLQHLYLSAKLRPTMMFSGRIPGMLVVIVVAQTTLFSSISV
jgi:hypothetical protein